MDFRWMAFVCAAAVTAGAHGQDAVQWRVQDGGNGHWYADDNRPQFATFAARQGEYAARGAHLATVTSQAEHAFVRQLAFPAARSCQWIHGLRSERAKLQVR